MPDRQADTGRAKEYYEKAPRPLVMLSKPPSRPASAPSRAPARKHKTTAGQENAMLLTENHRRAMDSIDALQASANPRRFQPAAPNVPASGRRGLDKGPMKARLPASPKENPTQHDETLTLRPPVAADSPRERVHAQSKDPERPARQSAGSALATSGGSRRQPVSRALLVDDHGKHVTVPENFQGGSKPERRLHHEAVHDMVGQGASRDEGACRKPDMRQHRPAKIQLPESFLLSESALRDRPHTTESVSNAHDHARRRPQSGIGNSEMSRGLHGFNSSQMRYIRNKKTSTGLSFRDRRPADKVAWQFRSSSPGPAGAAYARPVGSSGHGQLLDSGVTYIGSAHTAFGDQRHSLQHDNVKDWPSSLRKSVWSSISSERGATVPDTRQRVHMLCENPELAEELFAQYAVPERNSSERVLMFTHFLSCLIHLECLQGSKPVLQLALEMAGVPDHEQEAKRALLSKEEASFIFEREASWYGSDEGNGSEGSAGEGNTHAAGIWGMSASQFVSCLSNLSKMLDEKRHVLLQKMPTKLTGSKNRRLPLNDLRELRGQQRRDLRAPASPKRSPGRGTSETVHSPLASISAMHREITDPSAKQAALFKALRQTNDASEYKRLGRQVARESMVQLDSAVKSNMRTLKEMEWLLLLRDQALTSLGLIVSSNQIRAAASARDIEQPNNTGGEGEPVVQWGPPSWAWVVPSDVKKPMAPVMDGWYLISGDPGPSLRLSGPLHSRSKAIKSIQDFKELGITVFNICLLRESSLVEMFVFDSTGRRIEEKANEIAKADGWYVMIHEAGVLSLPFRASLRPTKQAPLLLQNVTVENSMVSRSLLCPPALVPVLGARL